MPAIDQLNLRGCFLPLRAYVLNHGYHNLGEISQNLFDIIADYYSHLNRFSHALAFITLNNEIEAKFFVYSREKTPSSNPAVHVFETIGGSYNPGRLRLNDSPDQIPAKRTTSGDAILALDAEICDRDSQTTGEITIVPSSFEEFDPKPFVAADTGLMRGLNMPGRELPMRAYVHSEGFKSAFGGDKDKAIKFILSSWDRLRQSFPQSKTPDYMIAVAWGDGKTPTLDISFVYDGFDGQGPVRLRVLENDQLSILRQIDIKAEIAHILAKEERYRRQCRSLEYYLTKPMPIEHTL